MRSHEHELEPIGHLVDAILDGHARHGMLPPLLELFRAGCAGANQRSLRRRTRPYTFVTALAKQSGPSALSLTCDQLEVATTPPLGTKLGDSPGLQTGVN